MINRFFNAILNISKVVFVIMFFLIVFRFSTFETSSPVSPSLLNGNDGLMFESGFTNFTTFQEIGPNLQGIARATSETTSESFQVTNSSGQNLTIPIDSLHGWKGTKLNMTISNIEDTRDWIVGGSFNDSILDPAQNSNLSIHQQEINYYYPNGTYFPDMTLTDSYQVYSNDSFRAMRIHFKEINVNGPQDYVRVLDGEQNPVETYSSSVSNTTTSWFETSKFYVGYVSNSNNELENAFIIDYIDYVPVNQTVEVDVESAHPYPNNLDGSSGQVITSNNSSTKYIRVHMDNVEIEGNSYDYLSVYDNNSALAYQYDTSGNMRSDVWMQWVQSNALSFNLTSDGTDQYWGYKIDKYQWSNLSAADFDSNARRLNISIHWNHYLDDHILGKDNFTVYIPNARYMRLNFTFINFESGYDYLVLFDNNSEFLLDYSGYYENVLTPWFSTDSINITYISDSSGRGERRYNPGYWLNLVEWINESSMNLSLRENNWTFDYDYDIQDGRCRGYSAERDGEVGLLLEISGINESTGTYGYETFSYESSDKSEFFQEIPISRGSVLTGYIKFDYYADKIISSNDFELFVAINGSKIYSIGFASMAENTRTWLSTGNIWVPFWLNTTDLFSGISSNSTLKFSIGIQFNHDSAIEFTGFSDQDRQIVFVDDIKLVLISVANSTQPDINLQVNGTLVSELSSLGWGNAQYLDHGNWTSSFVNLSFTTNSPQLKFNLDVTLDMESAVNSTWQQDFTKQGVLNEITNGDNASWFFFENVYIPSGYQDYNLTVQIPSDWKIDTIEDPTGLPVSYQQGQLNDSVFYFSTSFPGWYAVKAVSSNYLKNTMYSFNNSTWYSNITIQDHAHLYIAVILARSLSIPSGNYSVEIFLPNQSTWYQSTGKLQSNDNVTIGPLTFASSNTTGGIFVGHVAWFNGTESGVINFTITCIHSSDLKIIYPADATNDNTSTQFVESIIPIRVIFNDTFTGSLINGAQLHGSLNSSPALNFSFIESASGIYDYSLDFTGIAEGVYSLVINASKQGYNDTILELTISLDVETSVQNFTSYHEVEQGFNASINFYFYDDTRNLGVSGATISASISSANYTIIDRLNGTYVILLNTSSFSLGSHSFSVNISKAYHEVQSISGTLNIIPRKASLACLNGTVTSYLLNNISNLHFYYFHPDYQDTINYSHAQFKIFQDSNQTSEVDPSNYTLTNLGNGYYSITLFTGPTTPFNTSGARTVYFHASNTSNSSFAVSETTISCTFILNKRPVHLQVFNNGTQITNDTSMTTGLQNDILMNVSIIDDLTSSPVTDHLLGYEISSGTSGNFSLQGENYTALIHHDDLAEGTFILSIVGTSEMYDYIGKDYLLTVQVITTSITGVSTYYIVEHGRILNVSFHYHDLIHDVGVPGANVSLSFSDVGEIDATMYSILDHGNGSYAIALNTTVFSPASRILVLNISKQYYSVAIQSITVEIIKRKMAVDVLNSSISSYMMDDVGPIELRCYHPDYTKENYTDLLFSVYLNSNLTSPLNTTNYVINSSKNDGTFSLYLHTGPTTPFNTTGLDDVYIFIINSSSSPFHVENKTVMVSFSINIRPIITQFYINGKNITNQSGISIDAREQIALNISMRDGINGSVITSNINLSFNISGGSNGSLAFHDGNYTAFISTTNLTIGTHILSITCTAEYYQAFAEVFAVDIIPFHMLLNFSMNNVSIEKNSKQEIYIGEMMNFNITLKDQFNLMVIQNASIQITIDGVSNGYFQFINETYVFSLSTSSINSGLKQIIIKANSAGYISEYFSFIIDVKKRPIMTRVIYNGTVWDNITPLKFSINEVGSIFAEYIDLLLNSSIKASNLTVLISSFPSLAIFNASMYTHEIVFNTSIFGIGTHMLSLTVESLMYSTVTLNIPFTVDPIGLNISFSNDQFFYQVKPGNKIDILVTIKDTNGNLIPNANVSYNWAGSFGFLESLNNGSYRASIQMPSSEGLYSIQISVYYNENYSSVKEDITVSVQRVPLSPEAITTNIIILSVIFGVLFLLVFMFYLRPKLIKRRLTKFEDVNICTVHKGPVEKGLTYICPECGAIYCTKCAQALYNNNDSCWQCGSPIRPFAVSYLDDWKSNLIYMMIYLKGTTELIHEESLSGDQVMDRDILQLLKKSIEREISKKTSRKKMKDAIVYEYFNSKIVYLSGEYITVVMISKIDSSFIKEKMNEFIEEYETLFFSSETKTWKEGIRNKMVIKTRMLIDKLFIREDGHKESQENKKKSKDSHKGGSPRNKVPDEFLGEG
ncbi:MAG: hypothetical protein ACTSVI_03725 [Promethearchaeota archaeon]